MMQNRGACSLRTESRLLIRSREEIEAKGLVVVPISGTGALPLRLRDAHAEIRSGPSLTSGQFKKALQELE
jgi:hypothetical protein